MFPKKMDWEAVCRRASGRRHYNAMRRFRADLRLAQVAQLMTAWGFEHGVQRRIAVSLGVSEATISRDMDRIRASWWSYRPHRERGTTISA
jgi:predicted DNA-binding transcriptional regulator YafY